MVSAQGRFAVNPASCSRRNQSALAVSGRNVLIVGDPHCGKSWVNGLTCEQMIIQGYCVCVIDPEGDYGVLESLPGVVVLGGEDAPPDLPHVARALRHFDLSVVIDLSHERYVQKVKYLSALLPMLASLRRTIGLAHRIVVDEAHYFLQEPNVKELLDFELGAYTIITYRPSDLHPDLRRGIEGIIAKRLTSPQEVQTLLSVAGNRHTEHDWSATLSTLAPDEGALLPGIEEAGGNSGASSSGHDLPRMFVTKLSTSMSNCPRWKDSGSLIAARRLALQPDRCSNLSNYLLLSPCRVSMGTCDEVTFQNRSRACFTIIAWHPTFARLNSDTDSSTYTTYVNQLQR
jgi:hypothetical protein